MQEKGIKYRHAWNIIKAGGKYYHLDATFDNSLGREGLIRYDYFCLGDKQLFRDHEPLIWTAPECTEASAGYYRDNKLSFTKVEEAYKRALQAAKKGKPLVFHWRGGYLIRDVLTELVSEIRKAASEKGRTVSIYVNWPQSVIQASFTAEADTDKTNSEEKVEMQEANEGELYEEQGE